jgi:hypothetical protein
MAGRPIKLNDELTKRICENLRLGLPYNLVCKAAGIHYDTFNEYLKSGRAGEDQIFVDFLEKVEAAEMECTQEAMRTIKANSTMSWQCASWYLQHRHPQEFGSYNKVDLDNKHSGQVKIVLREEDCGEDSD